MSRTGLYDCHNFEIFRDDIMRDSNFGMGVLHVKVKYWRIFCDVISLLARVFIVSCDRAYKEVSTKNIEIFLWLSFCDMTVPSKTYVPSLRPWPLTYEGQLFFLWIDYKPIGVLYKFQSDISTNSREIKYQNIEKSPSLIIERFVSMATTKIDWADFEKKVLPWFSDLNTSTVRKSGRSDQYCGLYIVQIQKNRQTDGQTVVTNILYEKSFRLSQSNKQEQHFIRIYPINVTQAHWHHTMECRCSSFRTVLILEQLTKWYLSEYWSLQNLITCTCILWPRHEVKMRSRLNFKTACTTTMPP